ncbi:hypothetical protein AFL01nite_29550 [Aeromicrobium flavum]|uniref:Mini-circle protein n=1 Tax=Aeromicrobium flavum TaxID=416568 RepID=A0A512HYV5_9ACTN|nr:DinB family protein [Aeromicrobium flavum]GEO90628.1 hypothetical protein AFL01nite_29550 [Aeromicrobium flavum]
MNGRSDLVLYLRRSREAVWRAVDGVDEYDARRPLTPSGTNLLGLVKHLATVEYGYVARCSGFAGDLDLPWDDEDDEVNADLWLTPDQSARSIINLHVAVAAHTERAAAALPPDAPATVPWWREPETTFDRLLVHLVAETAQHAGHLEILREQLDGQGDAWDADRSERDASWWAAQVGRIEAAAEPFRGSGATVAAVRA